MRSNSPDVAILAGGRGTRLQQVVSDRPKPMALVSGRPFLEWLLLALREQQLNRVILCTGYMAEVIENYFQDGRRWGLDIVYSKEPFPLGTGGAVRHALPLVGARHLLVLNGDSYCRIHIGRLKKQHWRRRAVGTIWVVWQQDCGRYGSVALGSDEEVTGFREKSAEPRPGWVNAGAYLLDRSVIEGIPAATNVSMERTVLPKLVGQGLWAVMGDGPLLDIGTPESYALANSFIAQETMV